MIEEADTTVDTPVSSLPPEVVELLHLVATEPTRPVMAALRREAPASVVTLARTTRLPAATVEDCLDGLIGRDIVTRSGEPPLYRFTDAGAALEPVLEALDGLRNCCEV